MSHAVSRRGWLHNETHLGSQWTSKCCKWQENFDETLRGKALRLDGSVCFHLWGISLGKDDEHSAIHPLRVLHQGGTSGVGQPAHS